MTLLNNFNTLTKHPQNAEELKGLILQLAIQGKLTENWRQEHPNVESASELLERIKAKKQLLVEQKKIRIEKPKKEFMKESFQFEIPDTWVARNITEFYSTIGSRVNQVKSKNYLESGKFPVVSQGKRLIEGYYNEESKLLKLEKPVIVFGDHTKIVKYIDFDFIIGADGTKILQTFEGVDTSYFFMHCSFYDLSDKGYARHYSLLKQQAFSLPPLDEQKAIVAIVNELFKEVEQLEGLTKTRIQLKEDFVTSALQRLTETDNVNQEWQFLQTHFTEFFTEKDNVKQLRDTILQLAIQGKLTTKWRSQNPCTEPVSELLKRIQTEKQELIAQKKIKKEKPLPPIKDHEKPYDLPEGWVWCRLTELTNVGTGSTPSKTKSEYYGGDIPWYTSSATNDVFAKVQDVMITQKALDETNCKIFPEGTLIIAMYGQGKTRGQISEIVVPGATNQAIAGMMFFESSKETKQYLKYFFQKFYQEIRLLAEGGAQPNLNVGKVKATLIPLPPLEEQKAIVKQVNILMALCDNLEEHIEHSQTQIEQLMQSCLREVFEERKEVTNE
ncbi:MAG: hypothetical protein BM564_13330 [Bacteroidetes bacterium MedPE-SWsnd-G2]|nr:MAG: hypothetical protein BM564_13330 [Bacteroidetes bacterium MedPE-SWsnd-G2]